MTSVGRSPSRYEPPTGYVHSVLYASPLGAVVLICQVCGAVVSEAVALHDAWHAKTAPARLSS